MWINIPPPILKKEMGLKIVNTGNALFGRHVHSEFCSVGFGSADGLHNPVTSSEWRHCCSPVVGWSIDVSTISCYWMVVNLQWTGFLLMALLTSIPTVMNFFLRLIQKVMARRAFLQNKMDPKDNNQPLAIDNLWVNFPMNEPLISQEQYGKIWLYMVFLFVSSADEGSMCSTTSSSWPTSRLVSSLACTAFWLVSFSVWFSLVAWIDACSWRGWREVIKVGLPELRANQVALPTSSSQIWTVQRPRHLYWLILDLPGYMAYLGMMYMEKTHNNPVMRTFCQLLVDFIEGKKCPALSKPASYGSTAVCDHHKDIDPEALHKPAMELKETSKLTEGEKVVELTGIWLFRNLIDDYSIA